MCLNNPWDWGYFGIKKGTKHVIYRGKLIPWGIRKSM